MGCTCLKVNLACESPFLKGHFPALTTFLLGCLLLSSYICVCAYIQCVCAYILYVCMYAHIRMCVCVHMCVRVFYPTVIFLKNKGIEHFWFGFISIQEGALVRVFRKKKKQGRYKLAHRI